MSWEIISQTSREYTARMLVPGGYLYRVGMRYRNPFLDDDKDNHK